MGRPLRGARRRRLLLASLALAGLTAWSGAAVAQAGGAPPEPCVPGTVWEDVASGVKYLCVYDELAGGGRWQLMSTGQRGSSAWIHRSTTHGCAWATTGMTSVGGSGAGVVVRSYRWPCQTIADRITQPAGELRGRIVIQVYDGGWRTCRDSGYGYSTTAAFGWSVGLDMGSAADCGAGTYRALGTGAFYQGGAWRGGSVLTPTLWLP